MSLDAKLSVEAGIPIYAKASYRANYTSPRTPLSDLMREFLSFTPGISEQELRGDLRRRPTVHARQAFMAFAYDNGQHSLPEIGRFLGRDHTTVLHGVREHKKRHPGYAA